MRTEPEPGVAQAADQWFTPARFALLLGLFILAMFPDVIIGGRTFIFRDFGLFSYPLAYHFRESFWRGEIPLWNPLSLCGIPFLAQWNTLVLYPGSLLFLLFPLEWSLGIFNLAHLFLCGLSMYALAWSWTGNRLAATVAGLAFAFNGFTLNCLMWPGYMASLAWMPLVVLTVERAWLIGGRRLVLAALTGAMQMLSGTPEIIFLTWALLGALWLLQLARREPPRREVIVRFLVVVLVVAGLAAAQLLPFLDLLRSSQREPGFTSEESAMPITGWANFLVPLFHTTRSAPGVHVQPDQGITSSYYLGIGLAALALMAAWRAPERRVRLLALATAFCLVLALGRAAGIYALLLKVFPPAGIMRYPIKFVLLPVFLVPLLAAFSVRAYLAAPPEIKKLFWRDGLALGLCFLATIGLVVGFAFYHPILDEVWATTALSGLTSAIFLAASFWLWFLAGRVAEIRLKLPLRLGLVSLVWLDVAAHAPRQNPTVDRAVFLPAFSPLTGLAPRPAVGQSRAMLSLEAIIEHRSKMLTNAAAGFYLKRLALFDNVNLLDGIPKLDGLYSLELREDRDVLFRLYPATNSYRAPLADFLSVSQLTCATNLFEWTARPSCLPMATAGQRPIFLDATNTLAALMSPQFDPRTMVFLQPEDKPRVSVAGPSAARIISSDWSAHRIALEVEAFEPALVVISQSFYHNWRAYVGDKPTRLLRANHAFQAVEVPAGRGAQRVTLIYEDRAFRAGLWISLASAVACAVIWFRRSPNPLPPGLTSP